MVFELTNQLGEFKLFEKDVLINLHWTLDDLAEADYFELMGIMGASEERDKQQDISALFG